MNLSALKGMAKSGYAARGIVYLIVGGFAVLAALGQGGDTTDTKGALLKLLDTAFGSLLLIAVALGLLCYALWRAVQALVDADGHGTDFKGVAVRGGLLVSAATHTALGVWAFLAAVNGAGRNGGGKSDLAAWLMHQPYGPWLVGLVGLCVMGAGIAHVVKGATRGYEKWFAADEEEMRLIRPVASAGLVARGTVFLIVGGLFAYAGLTVDPETAGGIPEALRWVRGLPLGPVLFLAIAVGLVCFGTYSLIEAVYRRIDARDVVPRAVQRLA